VTAGKPILFWKHAVDCIAFNRSSSYLQREVEVYEKLDGTNFGIRCDGATYGRRYRIHGNTYQRVDLDGAIPTAEQVAAIKHAILSIAYSTDDEEEDSKEEKTPSSPAEEIRSISLVLYGELMCNPGKYKYSTRYEGCKYFCFGAVFDPVATAGAGVAFEDMKDLHQRLIKRGLNAEIAPESGRIRLTMSRQLSSLVTSEGVQCAPLLEKGSLRDVCYQMREELLRNQMEGVVITGKNCLMKWKTPFEDESKGDAMLSKLLSTYSEVVMRYAGVDVELARLLLEVAENPNKLTRVVRKDKKKSSAQAQGPYSNLDLEKGLQSALSKYDSLEAYFDRGELGVIQQDLKEELIEDFNASREDEKKCIYDYVNKQVGKAFRKWKVEASNSDLRRKGL